MTAGIRKWFVRSFWAAHNSSSAVRKTIDSLLTDLGDGRGLNLGCGDTRLDPRLVNFDLMGTGPVDVRGDALALPFPDGQFALVISQEMVEHVPDPFRSVREMARVLRAGGTLYLQAPFVIGYHPGPEDYWRFSRAGMRRLLEQAGLECRRVEPAVGAGTGMYRITVEFFAGLPARILPAVYIPAKALGSVIFFPLVWLNGFLARGKQSDRIPGGYFAIGVKKQTS
ncbi:MAG: class I SAM-dependent methyltransferase [Anaerolineales bacterium]